MVSKLEKVQRKIKWESNLRAQRSPDSISVELEESLKAQIAGDYEDSIKRIHSLDNWKAQASAWRLIGHAELGLGNAAKALVAHQTARELNEGKTKASAEDEVNIASAQAAMGNYSEALQSAKRALQLAPRMFAPWLTMIGVLNRQKNNDELDQLLEYLLKNVKDFKQNPILIDHLENDVDFIGIKNKLVEIENKRGLEKL